MKQKYFIILGFIFICEASLFSQIANEGIFQIMSGTEVYFGSEYTNKTGATHNNQGNLHFNDNFINNGSTSVSTSGTTYFDSSVNTTQTISGTTKNCNFYNLEINITSVSKNGVTVEDNFGLYVDNIISLTSGDLRLTGEAQLIQLNNVVNSGIGKLLKDQQGISSTYGYNYWSSPVNTLGTFKLNGGLFDGTDAIVNAWINSFTPKQILFNSVSPYNGIPSVVDGTGNVTTAATVNTRWFYTYSPNVAGYAGWNKINQNSGIAPGTGYSMKGTGTTNQNYVFKGTPNNGDYSFNIVAGQSVLLGNPYPSALDAEKFITDNFSVNEIYFWVDGGSNSHYLSDYLGGYAVYNLTGGVSPSVILGISGVGSSVGTIPGQYTAVGQAFFIDATASGTINFKNSQRAFVTEAGDSEFLKTAKKGEVSTITTDFSLKSIIRLGYRDPEGFHRQIVLGFVPKSPADINYNPGYDAIMVGARADELFFIIENDLTKKYVIQGVGSYDDSYVIPLGLIMTEDGVHTILLDAVENFTETVYVFDKLLNTTYNLSENNFIVDLPIGTYLDRFALVFKPIDSELALGIEEFNKRNFNVYFNGVENIVINNKISLEINQVLIYNSLGQQLLQLKGNKLEQKNITIPFYYSKGMYLAVIETAQGTYTYKIIN